jgi:hypothetical protein
MQEETMSIEAQQRPLWGKVQKKAEWGNKSEGRLKMDNASQR